MEDKIIEEDIKEEAEAEQKAEAEAKENKKESKKEKKNKHEQELAKKDLEIEALQKEVAMWKNEYLKAHAETENFKKRTNEQLMKDRKYASQKIVGELINPIDMLVQIINMPAPSPEVSNYVIGFQMITNQLVDVLKNDGLAPIEALNKEFNPNNMQAVETVSQEDKPNGVVVKVMQPGYMYKDRVLRPAMVVVNKIENKEENEEK